MKLSSFFFLAKIGFSEDLAEFDARCPDLELGELSTKWLEIISKIQANNVILNAQQFLLTVVTTVLIIFVKINVWLISQNASRTAPVDRIAQTDVKTARTPSARHVIIWKRTLNFRFDFFFSGVTNGISSNARSRRCRNLISARWIVWTTGAVSINATVEMFYRDFRNANASTKILLKTANL